MPYKETKLDVSIDYKIFNKLERYTKNKEFYSHRYIKTLGTYSNVDQRIEIYLDNIMHYYRDGHESNFRTMLYLLNWTVVHELCHHFIKGTFPYSEAYLDCEENTVEKMTFALLD